jgi:3-oxoacyl-[acyl-carrier protein] reductase
LVTGGGGGIGRAVLSTLDQHGFRCVALDADHRYAQAAAETLHNTGQAEAIGCDVSDGDAVTASIAELIERTGRVDVLVNAAGWPGQPMSAIRLTREVWHRTMAINYHGTVECTMAVLPSMRERGSGRIINIASMSAIQGARGQAAYSGSKAATLGLTFALAKEMLGHGVTVNAITPGFIRTPMMELPEEIRREWRLDRIAVGGDMGEPEDVADLVAFLASDRARYITGAVIPIDGGAHLGFP